MTEGRVRVWDPLLRALHWALVAAVVAAFITTFRFTRWHELAGKVALGIIATRLAWGFVGPRHARWRSFLRGPRETLSYARDVWRAREPRHLGHNPLGGWMAATLVAWLLAICASGLLFLTDAFWGSDRVSTFHELAAWSLLALVAAHVVGVVFTSRRHRENLVAAMVTGRKRSAAADDVE